MAENKEMIKIFGKTLKSQLKTMNTSLLNPWHWARDDFREPLEWLLDHQKQIRKGVYLSNTPGKEVWRFTLPMGLGDTTLIYKYYDYDRFSLFQRMGKSLALQEAMNFAALKAINVPVADLLACGENRHAGLLHSAYIISRCIPDSYDGSVLTPTGNLWEKHRLRMGFSHKAMEHIAKVHISKCFYSSFRAHKILFPKNCNEDEPDMTFIDAANCQFKPDIPMRKAVIKDLVRLFVDLRLSVIEIKELCAHYLKFNPDCGYTVDTMWDALTKAE